MVAKLRTKKPKKQFFFQTSLKSLNNVSGHVHASVDLLPWKELPVSTDQEQMPTQWWRRQATTRHLTVKSVSLSRNNQYRLQVEKCTSIKFRIKWNTALLCRQIE
jgi:hypothetical protein